MGVKRMEIGDIRKDSRGWACDIIRGMLPDQTAIAGCHVASIKPGALRGNHLHEGATEWMLLFGGRARVLWQPPGGGAVREERIESSGPIFFEIPPGHPHAIENLSSGDIFLAVFYDRSEPGSLPSGDLRRERLE